MSRATCKLCKIQITEEIMKEHYQAEHPERLLQLARWLKEQDEKVRNFEQVASEGMQGYREGVQR